MVLYLLRQLENLFLTALTQCVGFVADGAIVVLENIPRHIEQGGLIIVLLAGFLASLSASAILKLA